MPKRMLQAQYILAVALVLILMVVGIWDIYATATDSPENTVSNLIGSWAREFPIMGVAIGVLLGHLFWPRSNLPMP